MHYGMLWYHREPKNSHPKFSTYPSTILFTAQSKGNKFMDILPYETFVRLLTIYNKETKRLDFFSPYEAQELMIHALQNYDKIIVLKARQLGISTLIRSWFFYQSYYDVEPRSYGVIAHTKEAANNIAGMDKTFNKNLVKEMRKVIKKDNVSELVFEGSGASLRSFTASSKGGTRSFQLDGVHLSEFAFYEDQQEFLSTMMATIGANQIIIESTPNAMGDKFYELIMENINAEEPEWKVMFFPWYLHPEYKTKIPPTFKLRKREESLKREFDLTDEQIYWRRKQIATLGKEKFMREYPATIEEAFRTAGTPYFPPEQLSEIDTIPDPTGALKIYSEPSYEHDYVMGVDVAAGIGKDYSAFTIIDCQTRQVVAQYWSNKITPPKFAEVIWQEGLKWNARVIVEANNVGQVVLWKLKEWKYPKLWKNDKGKYFFTNNKTRPILFENLKEIIEDGLLFTLNVEVVKQLETIQYEKDKPVHPKNGHDDIVVSMALAYYVIKDEHYEYDTGIGNMYLEEWKAIKKARRANRTLPWNIKGGNGKGAY